ncbi:MAG: SLC13 family permease [Anaerolineae bacterium]|nr:SLC13 family permease [Anaerolineae bacterium]
MTTDIALFLTLLAAGLILFAFEWVAADVTALGLMLALVILGLLDPAEAFAGFGSETALMIMGLLILTETLISTGMIDLVGQRMVRMVGQSPRRVQWMMMIAPAAVSAFISNTASAAFFLPITLGLAHRAKISASKLLMPLAFAAILAGSTTFIGTSTNLVVSGLMQQYGLEPLGMFELTPVGLPILIVGLIYMAVLGVRLIPDRIPVDDDHSPFDTDLYFTEIRIPADSPVVGRTIEDVLLAGEMKLGMLELQRNRHALNPLADTVLQADDVLLVEGSRVDMLRLPHIPAIEISGKVRELDQYTQDGLAQMAEVVLLPGSPLVGRTIRGLGLRERFHMQILAVRRAGTLRHNKIGRVTFNLGDVLLIHVPHTSLNLMEKERYFRVLDVIDDSVPDLRRVRLASAIFAGSLLVAILGLLPLAVAVMTGVLLMFLTGCITPEEAYRNIQWKTIILIGSMLAFGQAMQTTGTADYLAAHIIDLPITGSPVLLLATFFALAVILTQPMSNQAAAAVLIPIALQTATRLGYDPRPFAITIALAASASFITPLEPASVIVYNAGRYKFMDFIRVGGLLTVIIFVIVITLVPLLWAI